MTEIAEHMHLHKVNRKLMLVNAHALLRNKFKRSPLWSFVSSITGHGSGVSAEICKECGWNPHQDAGKELDWK